MKSQIINYRSGIFSVTRRQFYGLWSLHGMHVQLRYLYFITGLRGVQRKMAVKGKGCSYLVRSAFYAMIVVKNGGGGYHPDRMWGLEMKYGSDFN